MSAYIDDIKDVMEIIKSGQLSASVESGAALRIGVNIKLTAQAISCVGEKEFRDYIYDKGQEIVREVGDDDFYPINPEPDFEKITRTIDEVYDRLKFELTSGPPAIPELI